MTVGRSQSGKIQVGCAIGVIVMVLAIWVAIKTVPVIANDSEFEKTIIHQAERVNIPGNSEKKMKTAIFEKAQQLGIPIKATDIHIKRSRSNIQVNVAYTLEIDYGFHVYVYSKRHSIDRPIF